jgi:hypothetical protein
MEDCGFPVIPRYLELQKWPDAALPQARVTHVWTQDPDLSAHVAKASRIDTVLANPFDMIGEVDGVLLARDDAETHAHFARPFLKAGIPVYIDKPLALTVAEAERLFAMAPQPGQLFSCSALRYGAEFQFNDGLRAEIGDVRHIVATTPKSWDTYAVHVIEPLLGMLDADDTIEKSQVFRHGDSTQLTLLWRSGVQTTIYSLGNVACPVGFRIIGDKGWCDLTFADTFTAFRFALSEFVTGVLAQEDRIPREFTLGVIQIIERGRAE